MRVTPWRRTATGSHLFVNLRVRFAKFLDTQHFVFGQSVLYQESSVENTGLVGTGTRPERKRG